MVSAKPISGRRRKFADEVLVHGNATQAYKAAGFRAKDDAVAATLASRLLKNAQVAAYIAARRAELAAKYAVTQERIVAEYERLAFSDPRQLAEWGPDGVRL